MRTPNWDNNQVLTWSGKWHIAREDPYGKQSMRTLCGAYGYTRDSVPKTPRLQSIAQGDTQAPACKKCAGITRRSHALDRG